MNFWPIWAPEPQHPSDREDAERLKREAQQRLDRLRRRLVHLEADLMRHGHSPPDPDKESA